MGHNYREYQSTSNSHSLEVENRLSKGETTIAQHEVRISYLERTLQYVIYAVGALATSKTGDIAELILSALKLKT